MEETTTDNEIQQEQLIEQASPLDLDIDDVSLTQFVDTRVTASVNHYTEKNIYDRRDKNKDYLLGRQLDESKLKNYQARFIDNIIWESESTIKPIAMSRLPDLYVTSGPQGDKQVADKITAFVNSEIRRRELRRVLGIAFKHVPIGFVGAIKYRWNPAKGKYGDYEFYNVHYSKLTLDHNAKSNDVNEMEYVRELVPMSINEMLQRFPNKKAEIFDTFGIPEDKQDNLKVLASKYDISEVWFKWNETKGDQVKVISAVLWKYKNLVLKKMKNPNWDWDGDEIYFKYDEQGTKQELSMDDLQYMAMDPTASQGVQTDKRFANYFNQPEFPYIFLGYDQYGEMPLDETSRIEQNILLQDNVNKRGRQITEINDRAKGKHIWSSISGFKKEDIEEYDMDDPDISVFMEGDLRGGHEFVPAEQASQALYQEQNINRSRMFEKAGVNATTRGVKETDTAATAEILQRADFGRIDDVVEDTINYAAEKIARAALQLVKLRYTEDHFVSISGKDGTMTYEKLNQDMIQDGQEVIVHASGVDKELRKKEAYEKVKLQMIDPLTFFEDTDEPNPKERTERLIAFMTGKNDGFATYMTKYVMGMPGIGQMSGALNAINGAQQDPGSQEALMTIATIQQGQPPQPPQNLTPGYISTIEQFIKSPDFQNLDPQMQQTVVQFAQGLAQQAQNQPEAPQGAPQQQPPQPQAPAPQAQPMQ